MKELKINIPEGHEVDWQESAKQKKIILKEQSFGPRSWEEYCKNKTCKGYFITTNSNISFSKDISSPMKYEEDRNLLPTHRLAEAFLAMMQLMTLRQAWIKDWKLPSNPSNTTLYYCLVNSCQNICIQAFTLMLRPLSFPTREMAEQFLNCFKNLIEKAKILILS